MQNSFLKFLSILFLLTCIVSVSSFGQTSNTSYLNRADSLFQQKRYTQSFEVYQTIFNQHEYSPAMLLKMAYIQEGLNQVAKSVYYLNMYYLVTQDASALTKMEEIADKYRLEGFTSSETDAVYVLYHKHHKILTYALGFILIFLYSLLVVQRVRYKIKPFGTWVFFVIFSALLLTHINFAFDRTNAIISKSNTYLMDGPSAGASVVSIVRDGHRVKINGKKDVWMKVQWGDQEVYVKETNLLPITL